MKRSPWIILVGGKSYDKCLTGDTLEGRMSRKRCSHKSKYAASCQKLKGARNDFPIAPLEGKEWGPADTLILDSASRTVTV